MINTKIIKVPKSKTTTSNGAAGFANSVSITNKTDITVDSELSVSSTNPVENKVVTEAINDTITDISNTDNTLNITEENRQVIIDSNTWKYDEDGRLYFNGDIKALQAILEKVVAEKIEAEEIKTENLTVTKSAHFFQLLIDEVKSTSGQIIITPANAKIDKVETVERDYPITYEDGNGVHYNQVEYIQNTNGAWSTSTPYIDTGIRPAADSTDGDTYSFEGAWSREGNLTSNWDAVFGADNGGSGASTWHLIYPSKNVTRVSVNTNTKGSKSINLSNTATGVKHTFKMSSSSVTIDNTTTSAPTGKGYTITTNLMLFRRIPSGQGFPMKLYYFKVFKSGVLLMDLIPVISENNVYGLFDKVNNTFYHSANSGAFLGGEEVTEKGLFGYKLYWKSEDDGKKIRNQFDYKDQILCQTFNVAEGEQYDTNNKFYWMLCEESGYETTTIDRTEYECNYIIVNNSDKDSNSNGIPEVGDEIVQLGNRNNTSRQNAIIISAYNNQFLDPTIIAPSIVQYSGINDYNLSTHRLNVISNGYNSFKGSYKTNSGDDIEQLIEDVSAGTTAYLHIAYANSADGVTDFTKVNTTGNYLYIGFCSNYNSDDTNLTYTDYTWSRLKGDTGEASDIYTLVPVTENVNVNADGVCSVSLAYNIIKQDGNSYTMVQATDNLYVHFYPYYQQTIQFRPTQLSRNTVRPAYSNNSYQRDWSTASDKLEYLQVELVIPPTTQYAVETVIDKRIVYVKYAASAELEITNSIKATVQGNYEELSGDITTINNSISTIEQNYDSISATVNSHTTQIDNNRTDIANLTIRANEISSTVSQQGTDIDNLESEITQKADEITLNITNQLNQTGINIQDGIINLYGENTNIVGNLNIYNSDEGLVIYDENNNARVQIKNDTLGDLEDFDFGSDKILQYNSSSQLTNANSATANFNFNIGTFAVGDHIVINGTNIIGYVYGKELTYSVSYTLLVMCGNTQVTSRSGTLQADDLDRVYISDINLIAATAGDYSIVLNLNYNFNQSVSGSFRCYLTTHIKQIQNQINKIATDGAVFASDIDNYNWFGSDCTEIKQGNNVLNISESGIHNKYGQDFVSTMPVKIVNTQDYVPTKDDCFVIFSNYTKERSADNRWFTLPDPMTIGAGKVYIVKSVKHYCHVKCAVSNKIYNTNDYNPVNEINIEFNCDYFITDGFSWYRMR
jgi:hypothetical protein